MKQPGSPFPGQEAVPDTDSFQNSAKNPYMREAINEALDGITHKHGGPFGSIIVKDGKIIGRGHNMVLKNKDSTAHGEISAIRDAEKNMNTYDLSGCELYTTGEPCPMCLFACLWAKLDKVHYGCTIEDNSQIGFRDEQLDSLVSGRELLQDYLNPIDREACIELFTHYLTLKPVIY